MQSVTLLNLKHPLYASGVKVQIVSKASRNFGKQGVIIKYCEGRYRTICRVCLETDKDKSFAKI